MNRPQSHRATEPDDLSDLTAKIIGCAIEVHRVIGPGLLENAYESAMAIELDDAGLTYVRQMTIPAYYKGRRIGEYHLDFIVEDLAVVEIKSVDIEAPLRGAASHLLTRV